MRLVILICASALILGTLPATAAGPFEIRPPAAASGIDPLAVTVVGTSERHQVVKGDDLLEIARSYGLGYTEVGSMNRGRDPFILPPGTELVIPTRWIVPDSRGRQIIVNTGEMRLYFFPAPTEVYTFPIGMGVLDFKTPSGSFRVIEKKVNPAWHIPKSLQEKYGMAVMPPGEDNPLGDYKLTLSWGDYGIHGTAMPLGVGRLVSHGCTRMYPEHIKKLFPMVSVGTAVEYIYEPAKVGFKDGRVFLSVHEDVYFKIPSMLLHVLNLLDRRALADQVDMTRVMQTVEEQTGAVVDVSKGSGSAENLTFNQADYHSGGMGTD